MTAAQTRVMAVEKASNRLIQYIFWTHMPPANLLLNSMLGVSRRGLREVKVGTKDEF